METPSLNSLYLAVSVLVLFILIVFIVCLKLISQDQRLDHLLQPEVQVIPVRRPVPLELAHRPVKYRKSRNHRNVSRGSQTAKATFAKLNISTVNPLCEDSEDETHVESVQLFSAPDFFQDPVSGYESVRAILRPPTTYSQVHQ